jgi:hypothetical protein
MMFIGLFFQIDAKLRPTPSQHAYSILNDFEPLSIFDLMLDMLVPSFANHEFEAYRPNYDDLADNLGFFGTLAGSTLNHDFGHLFPATIWIRLHNLMATLSARTSYDELASRFYTMVIATITMHGIQIDVTPAHYFGSLMSLQTQHHRYHNWMNQVVDEFLAPNAIRVINSTSTITRLPLDNPATTDADSYNPYLFLIGYEPNNDQSYFRLLRNMNDFVKATFPSSKPLRAYTQLGNEEISRHLTFDSVLPTWHTGSTPGLANVYAPTATTPTNLYAPGTNVRTPSQFATDIKYLVARSPPSTTTPTTPVSIPTVTGELPDPNPTQGRLLELTFPHTGNMPDDPAGIRLFSNARHVLPEAIIFDPSSSSTAHLAAVITSGKVIEKNDLSAIGLILASARIPLSTQNSQYILGAIEMSHIRSMSTSFPFIARRTNWNSASRTPQMIIRSLADRVIIPLYRIGLITPAITMPASGSYHDTLFPGASFLPHARNALDGLNVFSTPLGTSLKAHPSNEIPIWSSYRYYDVESRKWYMLPTLRHIYGTRARLSSTRHPSLRIN